MYVNLSSFFIMHPDLVLLTSLSCIVGIFSLEASVLSLWLMPPFLVHCPMFSTSCWRDSLFICPLHCSSLVTLFYACLLVYAAGFLLMLLSKSASGSVVMLDCLFDWCCRHAFCCHCCWFYVSSVSCNASSICCKLDCIWSAVMIMVTNINYHPMGPQSAIFLLDCYSWPYWNIWKYWWGIIIIFGMPVYELAIMGIITVLSDRFAV